MKVRVASALSFAGVLVAGSAAALVNSQVLQPFTSTSANAAAETITTHSAVPGEPSPATQASYRVGDAGAVLLDTSGDILTVVSATPFAGWVVASASAAGETVSVVFQQDALLVTFTASFISGVVATSVDTTQVVVTTPAGNQGTAGSNGSSSTSTPSNPGVTAPRTTVDDDSDDDDDHADDHDDDDDDSDDDD